MKEMNENHIRQQMEATLQLLKAMAAAIYQAGEIPSGHLYVRMMGKLSLDEYEALIERLKGTGLVSETRGHLLRWSGPQADTEAQS